MSSPIDLDFLRLQSRLQGRYLIERELGRGGMAVVFLARDLALDRLVALKVLPPLLATQASLRERFLREARTSAQLSHPHIVPIFAVEETPDEVFFAMAFVEGETLEQRIRRTGPLPIAEAVRILREIAWALAYAHQRQIIHRDIKPENVLLEIHSGRAQVSDFGIAHAGPLTRVTTQGEVLGTPAYMSPEQAAGDDADAKSDIYSLGVLGYFVLTGRLPFEGTDPRSLLAKHLTQPPPPLSVTAPHVPERLAVAIERCLAKAPEQRFSTAEAFADAIGSSVAVARPLPKTLARWATAQGQITLTDALVAPILGWTIYGMVRTAIFNAFKLYRDLPLGEWRVAIRIGDASGEIAMFAAALMVWFIHRTLLLRRALAEGYDLRDVRHALISPVEDGEEAESRWSRVRNRVVPTLLGVLPLVVLFFIHRNRILGSLKYTWRYFFPTGLDALAYAVLIGFAAALALGSIAELAAGFRARGPTLRERVRRWLWSGSLGAWLVRLARAGLPKRHSIPLSTHRLTETALGSAVQAAFDALPKEHRQVLRHLPGIIDRLELKASEARKQLEDLDGLTVSSAHPQIDAMARKDEQIQLRHSEARSDLERQRHRIGNRLRTLLTTLETLRLDLLRLRVGGVQIPAITADIDAAQDLSRTMEAQVEVLDILKPGSHSIPSETPRGT